MDFTIPFLLGGGGGGARVCKFQSFKLCKILKSVPY